jgi:hypothetical protein
MRPHGTEAGALLQVPWILRLTRRFGARAHGGSLRRAGIAAIRIQVGGVGQMSR